MSYIPADAEYDFEHAPYKSYSVTVVKRVEYYGIATVEARDEQEVQEIANDQAMSECVEFDEAPDISYVVQDTMEN